MVNSVHRKQFSSCDSCRQSRLSCDAHQRMQTDSTVIACTRCQKRNQLCTFEWLSSSRNVRSRRCRGTHERNTESSIPTENSGDGNPLEPTIGPLQHELWSILDRSLPGSVDSSPSDLQLGPMVTAWPAAPESTQSTWSHGSVLRAISQQGFNTIFGSWLSKHGCPLISTEGEGPDDMVDVSAVCKKLDIWMNHCGDGSENNDTAHNEAAASYLDRAIEAFSARWLSKVMPEIENEEHERTVTHLWRRGRQAMMRAINKASYSSMLSLFIFALTPMPVGISEAEESDGITGQVCIHAALQHIQTLRARHRNLLFSGSIVLPYSQHTSPVGTPMPSPTPEYITAESTAFWAALTFDTSASLTLSCRSLLSAGLFGFEAEPHWRLVRAGSKIFHDIGWCNSKHGVITDDAADKIIASSTAWKLLTWKLVAVFKEALRDAHDETEINATFAKITSCIHDFDTIYRPPLLICRDRILFLNQEVRFRWYSMMLHYHLCILLLVDILETSHYFHLLAELRDAALMAENVVMNTLEFGLQSQYRVQVCEGDTKTLSMLSFDPYPHHVFACVRLISRAIERDLKAGKISEGARENVHATLEQVLDHLPRTSKSVQAARNRHKK